MVIFRDLEESFATSLTFTSDFKRYNECIHSDKSDSTSYSHSEDSFYSSGSRSPVSSWLYSLRVESEVESLSALQAKSVALTEDSFEALGVRNAHVSIRKTRKNSASVINQVDYLIDSLPFTIDDLSHFNRDIIYLSSLIQPLVDDCRRRTNDHQGAASGVEIRALASQVLEVTPQIQMMVSEFMSQHKINNAQIEAILIKLKEKFGQMVNLTITTDANIITTALRFPYSSICCKWSLLALWQLTQNDAYLCRIFVSSGVIIRRLLKISCSNISSSSSLMKTSSSTSIVTNQLKASALRVLTYLCVNESAMKQVFFEPESGSNLITLLAFERSELVLKEAISLLVQITTPLIDGKKLTNDDDKSKKNESGDYKSFLPISLLVKTLTNLAKVTSSKDMFLLITASLANISFLEKEAFVQNETCSVLLTATKQKSALVHDIPLLDQLATILANISSDHPLEIIASGGLVYLLSALELTPNNTSDEDDMDIRSAIERIQQKVAAALARLASHKSCASLIHRLGGLERLVHLVREAPARNFSETVLIASLAAVRRISATLGKSPLSQLKALDLVDHDLREVFVRYSTKAETYV